MWFDLVLIDRVFEDGTMESLHIRHASDERFAVSRLEDIDPNYRNVDELDAGALRIYGYSRMRTTKIKSKIRNFTNSDFQILLQLEHFGIPVVSGYYAIILPKFWRLNELRIYDPYSKEENAAEKRSYRGIDIIWDERSKFSCAQFNMESLRRGTFSIGVIASLVPDGAQIEEIDRAEVLDVNFSDLRHHGHPSEEAYRAETDRVIETAKTERPRMPAINLGMTGPTVNIVEWARYIKDRIRRPRS